MTKLAKQLHDYAEKHYDEGWDAFVECGMEYCEEFVEGLEDWPAVKKMAEQIIDVWEDRRAEAAYQIEMGG